MDVTIAEQNVCMHNYTCITSRHLVLRDLCNDAQVPYLSSSGMPEWLILNLHEFTMFWESLGQNGMFARSYAVLHIGNI